MFLSDLLYSSVYQQQGPLLVMRPERLGDATTFSHNLKMTCLKPVSLNKTQLFQQKQS